VSRAPGRCLIALGALALTAGAGAAPPQGLTPTAQANYMLNCMGCHLPDGSGAAGKVPSVRDTLVPLAMSAAGRRYLLTVPGVAQSVLTDAQLAQVLTWMVHNLSGRPVPRGFRAFGAAEVAAGRARPLTEVRTARQRLLSGSVTD
jgi:mono/diheme cytochrome c family protein